MASVDDGHGERDAHQPPGRNEEHRARHRAGSTSEGELPIAACDSSQGRHFTAMRSTERPRLSCPPERVATRRPTRLLPQVAPTGEASETTK